MPSWIGPWEIAIVVIIALLIFGPRKLPELGSSFGKSIRGFKKGLKEGQDELNEVVAEVKEASRDDDTPVTKATTAEATTTTTSAEATAEAANRHRHRRRGQAAALLGHVREGRRVLPPVHGLL